MRLAAKLALAIIVLIFAALVYLYFYLPVNRVGITSELIMLGDLNNDNRWDNKDKDKLYDVIANPFLSDRLTQLKIDINKNELIDREDLSFLEHIYKYSDPYLSEQKADEQGLLYYPRPREFLKYLPKYEYVQRPLYSLKHIISETSPFSFLKDFQIEKNTPPYERQLLQEIFKSIPKNLLPSSVALENYLLPGNKEDGLDKSRHWNVFGGVAIYKSPEESLVLALERENMDLKDQNYSPEAMQEFIRDTIANINGIYYVVSINPTLISGIEGF